MKKIENNLNSMCDPETGVCEVSALGLSRQAPNMNIAVVETEVIYVGDPMCSWCWGMSQELEKLHAYCEEQKIKFNILVGGLRPTLTDPWNEQFKSFLKHHWNEISKLTGQPFSYKLFEKENFEYKTEPACRAIVGAKQLLADKNDNNKTLLNFFSEVQKKFYVNNQDPNEVEFYEKICLMYNLNFNEFKKFYLSDEIKKNTSDEFDLSRSIGVRGFPTVLLKNKNHMRTVTAGYSNFINIKEYIESKWGQSL